MNNKRGALLHWVVVGVFLAIGVFLVAARSGIRLPEQGRWQLDFLEQTYLQAEKDQLQIELAALHAAQELVVMLAKNGGYLPGSASPCGAFQGTNLWNRQAERCFPDAKRTALGQMEALLREKLPATTFTELGFQGTFAYGKGQLQMITTPSASYTYDPSYALDIRYNFLEYEQLKQEAERLLIRCGGRADTADCIHDAKPLTWKRGTLCIREEPLSAQKIVPFCVVSRYRPDDALLEYHLALDFTTAYPPLEVVS